jgi:nucleoside-diphosphate-sugar epimerase
MTQRLAARGDHVTAISRHPTDARTNVTPVAADVRDLESLARALPTDLDAVFFTVDIHGFRKPRAEIHSVMVDGCRHAMEAAIKRGARRFVLLSVLGADQSSWVWHVLNAVKPGMRANILEREEALKHSGMPFIIVRAPRLTDAMAEGTHVLARASKKRLQMKQGVSRSELARLMVESVDASASHEGETWDVVSNRTP